MLVLRTECCIMLRLTNTNLFILLKRSVHTIQFLEPIIQLLLKLKEVNDANQHFYELKQYQKNNWIQKMDCVN